ncbi:MAG: sel1 repeat family protein [Maricaulaceae bacterium]|nr:sel1 repeat family protein [Maricaulaceae bacterium]
MSTVGNKEDADWLDNLRSKLLAGGDVGHEDIERINHLATSGNVEAQFAIGTWHIYGAHGVPENKKKGLTLIDKAAHNGNVDALLFMGLTYECGDLVEIDTAMAVNYFICAAVLGSPDGCFNLSRYFDEGIWLLKDKDFAKLLRGRKAQSN